MRKAISLPFFLFVSTLFLRGCQKIFFFLIETFLHTLRCIFVLFQPSVVHEIFSLNYLSAKSRSHVAL